MLVFYINRLNQTLCSGVDNVNASKDEWSLGNREKVQGRKWVGEEEASVHIREQRGLFLPLSPERMKKYLGAEYNKAKQMRN